MVTSIAPARLRHRPYSSRRPDRARLIAGLSHENAARYSFLLATPIIFAAAVLKVPDLFDHGGAGVGEALVGAVCAAISAWFSVRFLTKFFETQSLRPFAIYCVAAGIVAFAIVTIWPPV